MSKRRTYPSDLNDKEWERIAPLLPSAKTGRPAKHSQREKLNAILYVTRSGCTWRMLPHDLPPWQTVYAFFRKLTLLGLWEKVLDHLRAEVRAALGRDEQPSLLIMDSQSVKTTEKGGHAGWTEAKR
jgi:putative transposase